MKKVNIIDLDNVYKDIIKNVKNKRRIYEFEKYKLEYLTLCADIINEGITKVVIIISLLSMNQSLE